MKAICPISGIKYSTAAFSFTSMTTVSQHPIFSASLEQLRNMLPSYTGGEMSDTDKRLFFLALLKRTGLVEFRHYAAPSNTVIAANILALLRTLDWDNRTNPVFRTPRYVVNAANHKLENIRHWINAWYETKLGFYSGQALIQQRDILKNREEALWKLIDSGLRRTQDYAKQLGKFAIDSTFTEKEEALIIDYQETKAPYKQVRGPLRDYWLSLFCLKNSLDILNTRTADLQEMYEFFEEKFKDNLTTVTITILRHISDICDKNKRGWDAFFGTQEDEIEEHDLTAVMDGAKAFIVVSTKPTPSKEEELRQQLIDNTPEEEPKPHMFVRRVEYLQAHARWVLKMRAVSQSAKSSISSQ